MNILLGIILLAAPAWFIVGVVGYSKKELNHENVVPFTLLMTVLTAAIASGLLLFLGKLQPF